MPTSFIGPFFAYPYTASGEAQDLLMDASLHARLLDLFAGVTPTTTVRGALFTWDYDDFGSKQAQMTGATVSSPKAFTDAMQAALALSGATDVGLIVDQKFMDAQKRDAFARLGLPIFEDEIGRAGAGIMHSKFFTFSELEFPADAVPTGHPRRMTHVVVVTSINADLPMFQAANNLLIMHGNPDLYNALVELWQHMRSRSGARSVDSPPRRCDDVLLLTFPRTHDTIIRILNKVAKAMRAGEPTRIRVAMYLFNRITIRNRLSALARDGADVNIVLSSHNHEGLPRNRDLQETLNANGVAARLLPVRSVGVMHSKYLLIDAPYRLQGEVRRRRIVWTGSHNYTRNALNMNDEILLRVTEPAVYAGYLEDWERLWNLAGK